MGVGWREIPSIYIREDFRKTEHFFDMGLETQVVFEHTDPRGGNSMNRIPEAKPLGVWMGGLS